MCLINGIVARASRCAGNTNRCADPCHVYDFCPPAPMYLTSVSILPDKDPLCRLYEAARCGVIHLIRIYAESDCATRGEAAKARGLRC